MTTATKAAPLDLSQFEGRMNLGECRVILAECRKQRAEIAALLVAFQCAYTILADVRHQWPGRHTIEGQGVLCALRDAICKATGREAEDVQDEFTNASLKGAA